MRKDSTRRHEDGTLAHREQLTSTASMGDSLAQNVFVREMLTTRNTQKGDSRYQTTERSGDNTLN